MRQLITFICPKPFCHQRLIQGTNANETWWACPIHGQAFQMEKPVRYGETCDACGNVENIVEERGLRYRFAPDNGDGLHRGSQPNKAALRDCEFYLCERCESRRLNRASEFVGV